MSIDGEEWEFGREERLGGYEKLGGELGWRREKREGEKELGGYRR
jgi:hypothetical protein